MIDSQKAKEVLLQAQELACTRGDRRLFESLEFSLSEAECLHVIGSNGSGKTSLLRIIAGINHPTKGRITWSGKPVLNNHSSDTEFLANLAYLGHKDGLKNELTSVENLSFYRRLENTFDPNQIDRDLAQMGILEHADISVGKLSFGQRRRLAFARLLRSEFKLWILDEPFTGVDAEGRELIEQICLEHLATSGAIILTNHQSLEGSSLAPHLSELRL
jgi:heme exporter protein A